MSRQTTSSTDEATFTPTLVRPTSTARRLRGRFEQIRLVWRRVAIAGGSALLAAGATVTWLTAPPSTSDTTDHQETSGEQPAPARPVSPERTALADDQRILALDRSAIVLPVSPGSTVEIIGLRPTVDDVRAEVIAARARVVGVTDEAVLVAVEADAAHTAAEIAAVGRVTILGRDREPR